jgi:crossover junction endodeoxyribonuclease RuvC
VIRVLGIDPGFASLGYAVVELEEENLIPLQLGVVRTEKSNTKANVLASDDNVRRIREISGTIYTLMEGKLAICTESQSWPRNASASAKVGMAWGALAGFSEILDIPLLQVSPMGLKKAVTGNKGATKEQVMAALNERFGRDFAAELVKQGVPASQHEHAYDALGAVVAMENSETFRLARRMTTG